ncbi:MAG TPA: oligopeptide transporter, OPT family, partial [Burkholderiaceae bacterium]|nr:oligopeptide transporter, OPT family [Burkholderiaceae bacterium]
MGAAPRNELTIRGLVLGVIITVAFTAANVYFGLKAGLTFATSIPAAVISMAVLRGFRGMTVQENNIVQTVASAAGTLSSIIFVLPGLVMIGWWQGFPYWTTAAITGTGGILGVLFSVPLRRTLIIEQKLRFPEGIAAAEVLKVGANPGVGAKVLGLATVVGGLFKFITSGLRSLPEAFTIKGFIGERGIAFFGYGFSPALLGVGYIV